MFRREIYSSVYDDDSFCILISPSIEKTVSGIREYIRCFAFCPGRKAWSVIWWELLKRSRFFAIIPSFSLCLLITQRSFHCITHRTISSAKLSYHVLHKWKSYVPVSSDLLRLCMLYGRLRGRKLSHHVANKIFLQQEIRVIVNFSPDHVRC